MTYEQDQGPKANGKCPHEQGKGLFSNNLFNPEKTEVKLGVKSLLVSQMGKLL